MGAYSTKNAFFPKLLFMTHQGMGFLADPLEVGSALYLVLSEWVSVSVCAQLTKLFNIFGSGWHIFLKSFGDIPRMFVNYFQIILKFLYVCLSVHWLTSLLKLDKYRDISCSWWYLFLKIFGDISGLSVHQFKIYSNFLYVCQSFIWLTSLLKLCQDRYMSWSCFSVDGWC